MKVGISHKSEKKFITVNVMGFKNRTQANKFKKHLQILVEEFEKEQA